METVKNSTKIIKLVKDAGMEKLPLAPNAIEMILLDDAYVYYSFMILL